MPVPSFSETESIDSPPKFDETSGIESPPKFEDTQPHEESPTAGLAKYILKGAGIPDTDTAARIASLPGHLSRFLDKAEGLYDTAEEQFLKGPQGLSPVGLLEQGRKAVKRGAHRLGDWTTKEMVKEGKPAWIAGAAGAMVANAPDWLEMAVIPMGESKAATGLSKLSAADLETAQAIAGRIDASKGALESRAMLEEMKRSKPLLLSGPKPEVSGEGFIMKEPPRPVSPVVKRGEIVAPGNLSEKIRPGESLKEFAERNNLGSTIQGDTHPRLPKISPKSFEYRGMELQPENPIEPVRIKTQQAVQETMGWNDPKPVKNSREALRWWSGREALAHLDADQMGNEIRDFVIDPDRRALIKLHGQLKRAPSVDELKEAGNALVKLGEEKKVKEAVMKGKQLLRLSDQGLELSSREQQLLGHTDAYFEGMKDPAAKSGAIERFKEGYSGPHSYQTIEEAKKGNYLTRILNPRTPFAQKRIYPNMFEAIKDGMVPGSMDIADDVKIYHSSVGRAIAGQNFKKLVTRSGIVNYEGKGVRIPKFDMPIKDPATNSAKMASAFASSKDAGALNRVLENPVFDNRIVNAIENLNRGSKKAQLTLSLFHFKALAAEALGKGINPMTGMSKGLEIIEQNPDTVRAMVREGLTLADFKDIGKSVWEGAKSEKGVFGKLMHVYDTALWQKYWTGIKTYATNVTVERFMKRGLSIEESLPLAVDHINDVFGGLNYKALGRSPNMQRLFKLVALAPDWTETRMRLIPQTFGKAMGDISPAAQKVLRTEMAQYWTRLAGWTTASVMLHHIMPFIPDTTKETGLRDYKKAARALLGDPTYFTSKASTVIQAARYFYGKHKKMEAFQRLAPLPINIKEFIAYLMKDL